jgi:hypothetical protein
MKKNIGYIICLLWALPLWNIQAQVVMGTEVQNVRPGAILELVSSDAHKSGLLLPKVSLTSATVWQPVAGTSTNGMVVFNTHNTTTNGLKGIGAYVWIDGRWVTFDSAASSCTAAPAMPGTISVTNQSPNVYEPFTASVAPVSGATSYEWSLPDNLIGSSSTNFIILAGVAAGNYTIQVRAKNDCGVSNWNSRIVTVVNPIPAPDSNGLIQGPTCYDVAMTESPGCGSLSLRKQAFPESSPALRTREYAFTLTNIAGISDLSVTVVNDADGIVQSVNGGKTGALSKTEPFFVTFVDNINSLVRQTHKSTATLRAIFKKGGVFYYTDLTITVQDCSCCPLDVAFTIPNAVYEPYNGVDEVPYDVYSDLGRYLPTLQGVYKLVPNAVLCVYKTNLFEGTITTWTWGGATQICKSLEGNSGWRLPNIMELAYHMHGKYNGYGLMSTTTPTRYFSSTDVSGRQDVSLESLYSQAYTIQLLSKTIQITNSRVRCVKTIR